MGMIAQYLMIDEETLESLMNLGDEDLLERFIEIEESEKFEVIDIDKIWDALHFFLTGTSASRPIEGNKLSEAIVGVHNFTIDGENSEFITCIENNELNDIINEILKINFNKLSEEFNPEHMKRLDIYPSGIWKDNKVQLIDEFKSTLSEILIFYKKALTSKYHIIVSII